MWQALTGHQWSGEAAPLVDALIEKTRQRMAKLLAAAYSQVRLRACCYNCSEGIHMFL